MLIKLILILAISLLLISFLKNRNATRFQAGKKLLFLLFLLLSGTTVMVPEALTRIANTLGVGRGTDLLLYSLVIAFLFVSLNTYLKFKDYDANLTRLARQIAIDKAIVPEEGQSVPEE